MKVKAEPETGVSEKTVGELRARTNNMAAGFGGNVTTRAPPPEIICQDK